MANETRKRRPFALYRGRPRPDRAGIAIDSATADRFRKHVDTSAGPDACWPWTGGLSGFGYGRMKIGGRLISPHRVAYVLAHGDLTPDGTYHGGMVMHRCDNPACCNPSHLRLGSASENARDMIRKGRSPRRRDVDAPNAKLNDDLVRQILASDLSSREASDRFGVEAGQIRRIRRGEIWAHVRRPFPEGPRALRFT